MERGFHRLDIEERINRCRLKGKKEEKRVLKITCNGERERVVGGRKVSGAGGVFVRLSFLILTPKVMGFYFLFLFCSSVVGAFWWQAQTK